METRIWSDVAPERVLAAAPTVVGRAGVFLDSASGGRWSLLGRSAGWLRLGPDEAVWEPEGRPLGAPREVLERWLGGMAASGSDRDPDAAPFTGGWMGYLGYGAGAWFDRIPPERVEPDAPPVGVLHWVDAAAVYDVRLRRLHLVSTGLPSPWAEPDPERAAARLVELEAILEMPESEGRAPARAWGGEGMGLPPPKPFEDAVGRAREAIGRGDVFQVNLAQRFELGTCDQPWAAYRVLRDRNPAPYAGYFRLGDLHLLSASPELLVESRGREVETCPIAGTFPRAADPEVDRARRRELRAHPKEQAEHVMLVDLERNDLGRVCEYGSVAVEDLLGVQSFATVHHLVSTVRGRLREGVTPAQVLAAVFPGGTITGAPKIRATEIIRELEPRARGPYTGSLGFVDLSGDQTWNISIRTVVVQGDAASVHAGAGVVWDSDPAREYRESVQKAKAFLELGGLSTRGVDLGG